MLGCAAQSVRLHAAGTDRHIASARPWRDFDPHGFNSIQDIAMSRSARYLTWPQGDFLRCGGQARTVSPVDVTAVRGSQLTYRVEVAAELLADVEEQTVRSVHQAQRPGRESPFERDTVYLRNRKMAERHEDHVAAITLACSVLIIKS